MGILVTVALVIFAVLKIKRRGIVFAAIIGMYFITVCGSAIFTELNMIGDEFTVYSDESEIILIKDSETCALVSISSHKKSDGYASRNILLDENIVDLDEYIIINYSKYLVDEIETVLTSVKVSSIKIPMPKNEEEENILIEAVGALNDFRVDITLYDDSEYLRLGDYGIFVPFRSLDENSFAVCFEKNNKIISYLSSGALDNCKYSEELLYISDTIIFGDYGKSYEKSKIIYDLGEEVSKIIVFDDKILFDLDYYEYKLPTIIYDKSKVTQ